MGCFVAGKRAPSACSMWVHRVCPISAPVCLAGVSPSWAHTRQAIAARPLLMQTRCAVSVAIILSDLHARHAERARFGV